MYLKIFIGLYLCRFTCENYSYSVLFFWWVFHHWILEIMQWNFCVFSCVKFKWRIFLTFSRVFKVNGYICNLQAYSLIHIDVPTNKIKKISKHRTFWIKKILLNVIIKWNTVSLAQFYLSCLANIFHQMHVTALNLNLLKIT